MSGPRTAVYVRTSDTPPQSVERQAAAWWDAAEAAGGEVLEVLGVPLDAALPDPEA